MICQHAPDHHDPERLDRTPVAVLTDILTRPIDRNTAAEIARRAGADETRSLAWVGTQWDLLTGEHARHRATDTLTRLLPADVAARLVDEPGYGRLMGLVRSMELAGHDPQAVLIAAVARRGLHDAESVSDVLRYRIRMLDNGGRVPERAVRDGDWTTFAAPWAGPVGQYAQVLAAAATARQTELGDRAAANPPAWALAAPALGPAPTDPLQRAEWVRRAGIVAAYRDLHAIPEAQLSIGEAPHRERAFHHALWRQALTALGHPADALDYATASDAELREMRDAWRRAQAWEPQFVAADLHNARELRRGVPPRRGHLAGRAGPRPGRQPGTRARRTRRGRRRAPGRRRRGSGRGARAHPGRPHRLARPHPRSPGARCLRRRRTRTPRSGPRHRRPGRRAAGAVHHRQRGTRRRCRRRRGCGRRQRRRRGYLGGADDAWSRSRASASSTSTGLPPAVPAATASERVATDAPRPPSTRPPPPPVGRSRRWPRTTRSRSQPNRPARRSSRRTHRPSSQRPHRTGTPSCSPRPNGPPNGNGSSPPCSRWNPRPSMSRPRSHCTSTSSPGGAAGGRAVDTAGERDRGRGRRRGRPR